MTQHVQLSCEQCKERKTKCDKGAPCASCKASGLTCRPVQRARLPRGKSGKAKNKNAALEDKVARLERLVTNLESQIQDSASYSQVSYDESIPHSATSRHDRKLEKLTVRDFWIALSSEIHGLRETLECSDEEEETSVQSADRPEPPAPIFSTQSILFLRHRQHSQLPIPSQHQRKIFLQIYVERVDSLFKVLHWPTVTAVLDSNFARNLTSQTASPNLALEYAIYFLAICTILDHEFDQLGLGSKSTLIEQYQTATETLLARADLLNTTDTVVLQAFVLYIAAIRCTESAASAWTLIAVAVRIADACALGSEKEEAYSTFELEIRRRLYFAIGFLDSQLAFGRGSLPLLSSQDLSNPPRVINDSEMSPSAVAVQSSHTFTDMSFSNMCHQGMMCHRKLIDPSYRSWRERLDIVNVFELSVTRKFAHLEFSADLKQRYAAFASKTIPMTMRLLLKRPPYKGFASGIPPSDDFDVLDAACRVLQTSFSKAKSGEFTIFSWLYWPKWFVLAVALVELCSVGSGPKFDRAFPVAQESYDGFAQLASDARSSAVWKSITKLMRCAQQLRHAHARMPSSNEQTELARIDPYKTVPDRPFSVNLNDGHRPTLPAQDVDGQILDRVPTDSATELAWLHWDGFLDDVNKPGFFDIF